LILFWGIQELIFVEGHEAVDLHVFGVHCHDLEHIVRVHLPPEVFDNQLVTFELNVVLEGVIDSDLGLKIAVD